MLFGPKKLPVQVVLLLLVGIFLVSCGTMFKPPLQTIFLQGRTQDFTGNESAGAGVWLDDELIPVDSVGLNLKTCDTAMFPICTAYYNKNRMRMGVGMSQFQISPSVWSSEYEVTIRKSGYKDQVLVLERQLDSTIVLNFLNLIGFWVDFLTGAMWDYHPKTAQLNFIKGSGTIKIGPLKAAQYGSTNP